MCGATTLWISASSPVAGAAAAWRRRAFGGSAEQPAEIVVGIRRREDRRFRERLEHLEARVQLVGVEVVDPLEAQLAGRHTEPPVPDGA